MVSGQCKASVLLACLSLYAGVAVAQPTLPDIAASVDKGIVVLSWNCQYGGVKQITVQRSADSVNNFATIGNVKNVEKGLQAFVDGHPNGGKNYYKLLVVFKSGLNWKSNNRGVMVDKSLLESAMKLPSNDSLQHFTVTEEKAPATGNGRHEEEKIPPATTQKNTPQNNPAPEAPKRRLSVSFDAAEDQPDLTTHVKKDTLPQPPKHKIVLSFGEPETTLGTTVQSRYVSIDAATGHVKIAVPNDVRKITYAVRFYDDQNKMAVEIPALKAPVILLDKRNFQKKGLYKFVMRRDDLELEQGYISVTPNP